MADEPFIYDGKTDEVRLVQQEDVVALVAISMEYIQFRNRLEALLQEAKDRALEIHQPHKGVSE